MNAHAYMCMGIYMYMHMYLNLYAIAMITTASTALQITWWNAFLFSLAVKHWGVTPHVHEHDFKR